jgi:hypothetical protein
MPLAKSLRSTAVMSGHTKPLPRWAGSISTLSRLARPSVQAGPATANPMSDGPSHVVITTASRLVTCHRISRAENAREPHSSRSSSSIRGPSSRQVAALNAMALTDGAISVG